MRAGFAVILQELGYPARHVYKVNLDQTPDEEIIAFACSSGETILSKYLGLSKIMALSKEQFPSIITFRLRALNSASFHEIVQHNFDQ